MENKTYIFCEKQTSEITNTMDLLIVVIKKRKVLGEKSTPNLP